MPISPPPLHTHTHNTTTTTSTTTTPRLAGPHYGEFESNLHLPPNILDASCSQAVFGERFRPIYSHSSVREIGDIFYGSMATNTAVAALNGSRSSVGIQLQWGDLHRGGAVRLTCTSSSGHAHEYVKLPHLCLPLPIMLFQQFTFSKVTLYFTKPLSDCAGYHTSS